ncbi:MAG: response regulator, partial [Acidobacteriaceae bacterium]|nr:response regulator [Acidobacteriaceae bacterium]
LNGIIGMMQLALDTDLTPEQRECLLLADTSADTLLSVINDILDFSKIEARKLHLESIEFDLRQCLDKAVKSLAVRAHQKNVDLICFVEPEIPEIVVGDPVRLTQIVVNLIGNAIKFTEKGEIVLAVTKLSDGDNQMRLQFTVSDTGIGIPEDRQKAIFEAFTQADGSSTRKYGGTGLGLSIASQLVSMMGGTIWVKSQPNQGSTFGFDAWFEVPTMRPAIVPDSGILAGMPVLVVDDNATSCEFITRSLSNLGAKALAFRDTESALAMAQRGAATWPVILLDADMPETTGFAMAEKLRKHARYTGTIIVMLSSGKELADVARYRELGVDTHITKPINHGELGTVVARAVTRNNEQIQATRASKRQATDVKPTMNLRILLVEDNPVNRKLAVKLLEKRANTVFTANNGREGLEKLEELQWEVDLILMDVQMPEMDGYQATAAIREREIQRGGRVPIIAMTAHALDRDRERCLACGMDAYLPKPIQTDKLYEIIESTVGELACR